MNEYPELLVSFEDVAVAFTWEEWQNLVDGQKILYRNVMLETYSSLVSLGQCVTKPELIFKLEQGAEPWTEAESPNQSLPGIQKIDDRIERSEKSQNRYLCRVEFTNTSIPVEENVELENTLHLSSNCKLRPSVSKGNCSGVKSKEFNVSPNTCLPSVGEKPDDCDKRKLCLEYHEHFSQHHKIHTGQRDGAHRGQGKASNKEAEFTENWIDQKQVHRTQTSEQKSLAVHQRTHSGDRSQGRSECGKSFHRKSKLSSDQTIPPGREPHECNECGKTFFYVSHLRKHCLIHRGEKPYECIDCGKTFLWNSRLKYHQRTHTNEKPFKCDECGKTFTQKTFLSQHQKTHTGEKPYVCNYCGRPFLQKSHLTYHTAIHTGEKHYVCNHCQKTFRQKSSLTTHELIHTGKKPYECHKCQKTFRHKSSLVNHELIHSGEKPFECIKCQKTFRHKSSLTNHEVIHSGEKT